MGSAAVSNEMEVAAAPVPGTLARVAAQLAAASAGTAVLALLVLHVLRPELSPATTMISEYAVGPHGWLMGLCFAAFATACAATAVSIVPWTRGALAWSGVGFLALATVGLAMAAAFPMDPATTPPDQMSFSGRMHGVAFMLGVPGQILSVLLVGLALRRRHPHAKLLLALAALVWLSLVVMVVALVIAAPQPGTPPTGVFGIPNRAFMVAFAGWLALAAAPHARRSHQRA